MRQCFKLNLNGVDYNLRITLSAQKEFMQRYPDTPVVAAIVSSFEDPEDMEFLLTKALNWDAVSQYGIWLGEYGEALENAQSVAMWQYTNQGKVPGIDGNVDINLFFQEGQYEKNTVLGCGGPVSPKK